MDDLTKADEDLARLLYLRRLELDAIMPWLPGWARILELGGGAGWQASLLSKAGYAVDSFDINPKTEGGFYPVGLYRGGSGFRPMTRFTTSSLPRTCFTSYWTTPISLRR